jgi:hypothetical protein
VPWVLQTEKTSPRHEFMMSILPGALQGLSVDSTVGGSSFSMERIEAGKSR